MSRKLLVATLSAALCLMPMSPALGMGYSYPGARAPQGANVTANIRIPFGRETFKPSYGLTAAFGQSYAAPTLNGFAQPLVREIRLADLRFTSDGLQRAQVATFDLANLKKDKRLNLMGDGKDPTLWIVVGLVAAGVAICLLADCFDGSDSESESPN